MDSLNSSAVAKVRPQQSIGMTSAPITQREIDLLVHHYTVEVIRWTDADDPLMLCKAKHGLETWERARDDAARELYCSTAWSPVASVLFTARRDS